MVIIIMFSYGNDCCRTDKDRGNISCKQRLKLLFVFVFFINFRPSFCSQRVSISSEEEIPEEGWGTLVAVTAMRGNTALLPCNIHANEPNRRNDFKNNEDPVLLVLWYKNASVTPVYSYDSRSQSSDPRGKHQWGDNEVWGKNSQRVWFDTSTTPAHLTVKDVQGRDEGAYRCKVHFKSSPSWSQRIHLIIKDPPGFPRIQDESGTRLEGPIGPYKDGIIIRIMCQSTGEPPPKMEWIGLESSAISSYEVKDGVSMSKATVVASRTSADNEITCNTITEDSGGKRIINSTSFTFNINLPPLMIQLEAPGAWVVGGQLTEFRCRVTGARPKAIIQWWIAGRQLTRAMKSETFSNGNVTVSTITITPKAGDDETLLVCKTFASNLPGTVLQDQITLRVHYVPVVTIKVGGHRRLKESSGSVDVSETSTVLFSCHVLANPAAYNVTWFFNGKTLHEKKTNPRVVIDQRTLRIFNVSSQSHGLYTCVASNEEGDGQSNALNLNVFYSPTCRNDLPREYIVEKGGSVTLACGVKAFPSTVTFSWAIKTDGDDIRRLPSVGRPQGLIGKYVLTGIKDDAFQVLCWARNSIGMRDDPCVFNVLTQGRPSAVSNCKVNNTTTSGFSVRCPTRQQFHGRLETVYTIQVYVQNRATTVMDSSSGGKRESTVHSFGALDDMVKNYSNTQPQFLITNLKAGREYAVVIRASNIEGTSPPSVISAFTLRDTAQTLKGMPSATQGSSSFGKKNSLEGGTVSETKGKTDYGDYDYDNGFFIDSMISPMLIIIIASLVVTILLFGAAIFGLRKRRLRRKHDQEINQININEELPYLQTIESSGLSSPEHSVLESMDPNRLMVSSNRIAIVDDGSRTSSPIDATLLHILPSSCQLTQQSSVHAMAIPPSESSLSSNINTLPNSNPLIIQPHPEFIPTPSINLPSLQFLSPSTDFISTSGSVSSSSIPVSSKSIVPSTTFKIPSSCHSTTFSHSQPTTKSQSTIPRRSVQVRAVASGEFFHVPSKKDDTNPENCLSSQSQLPLLGFKQLDRGGLHSSHFGYQGCQKLGANTSSFSGAQGKAPTVTFHPLIHVNILPSVSPLPMETPLPEISESVCDS